jgi:hypothetical protein
VRSPILAGGVFRGQVNDTHTAIRDLAENPLLLTIVALVHRIDAVLPDERVVLYQKCTETLLNTWHTWKFRSSELANRGKVERRNRYRMEAIAHWMHSRSTSADKAKRAVVSYEDLGTFLTQHISENEKAGDLDDDPQDLATNFLDFVKSRAGLLIEVGDRQYSFVHLTFQEYLTSSYIITATETMGASGLWATIKDRCADPRWHEVIRLLVAGLKSNESQRLAIKKLLSKSGRKPGLAKAQLLGGLLVDGIEPAQERAPEILSHLILSGCRAETTEQLRPIASILKNWGAKAESNMEALRRTFEISKRRARVTQSGVTLALLAASADLHGLLKDVTDKQLVPRIDKRCASFKFFFDATPSDKVLTLIRDSIQRCTESQHAYSLLSPAHNFIAASVQMIATKLPFEHFARMIFDQQMVTLATQHPGPFSDFTYNQILISAPPGSSLYSAVVMRSDSREGYSGDFQAVLERARKESTSTSRRVIKRTDSQDSLSTTQRLALERLASKAAERILKRELGNPHMGDLQRARNAVRQKTHNRTPSNFWREVLNSVGLSALILDFISDNFRLTPRTHWWEALRVAFLPSIVENATLFDEARWSAMEETLRNKSFNQSDVYFAAWLILLDVWLVVHEVREAQDQPLFATLNGIIGAAKNIEAAPLVVANCVRDISLGETRRKADLLSLLRSSTLEYRELFERCLWVPPRIP